MVATFVASKAGENTLPPYAVLREAPEKYFSRWVRVRIMWEMSSKHQLTGLPL